MAEYPIIPEKTALLFFDVLNGYMHPQDPRARKGFEDRGEIPPPENTEVIAAMARANTEFRKAGVKVVYAQADHRPDYSDFVRLVIGRKDAQGQPLLRLTPAVAGAWEADVMDEIAPQPGDYVIKKHRWSAFFQTHLQLSLRTAGIDTLLLAGGGIGVGVASTAYAARDHDFNQIILRDLMTGGTLEARRVLLDDVFQGLARVMTVDEALAIIKQ